MYLSRMLVFACLVVLSAALSAQNMLPRYQKAEQFLPKNTQKLTRNVYLYFNEVEDTPDLWYKLQTETGYTFFYFDGEKQEVKEAFDHELLAEALTNYTGGTVVADSLSLKKLKFYPGKNEITFRTDTFNCRVSLDDYSIKKEEKPKKRKRHQSVSPDKKWVAEVRDYNLFLVNAETKEEFALTTDGVEKYEYASPVSWYKIVDEAEGDSYKPSIYVNWSKDSKKLVCSREDRRKVGKLYLYQSLPDSGYRAKVWSYERPLPGEPAVTTEYYAFDVASKSGVRIDVPPFAGFTSNIYPNWFSGNNAVYFAQFRRGYKAIDFYRADANSGKVTKLLTDSAKTMVEYQMVNCKWLKDESGFFWTSERDGWNQIYRYDKNGVLMNQVTSGIGNVRNILRIDEKKKLIYFRASGRNEGIDPYYSQLFVASFDGKKVRCLTPEDADHLIWMPKKGDYFVDSYSRVDLPTKHVFRSLKNGKVIKEIATAKIDELLAKGWKYPERFRVKARDGKTDLYGVIFFPSDFDSTKVYPIIDATYSGPQAVRTPKSFSRGYRNYDQSVAELGFIVVTIDGLGSAWRSKSFHDVSYENLGDIGAEDHIKGIKELAKTRSWMDVSKVGIYGHSAGGYDAVRAMLMHPEFYKVGVSSAGNHDHRIAKAWWPEQYMGMPGKHYDEQSNFTHADKLEGKLLLVHGDMDNNVNPASSLRLAAKFVEYNKDFELLLIPNRNHSLADHPYFIRKRWDWFVLHLLRTEIPPQYDVESYK